MRCSCVLQMRQRQIGCVHGNLLPFDRRPVVLHCPLTIVGEGFGRLTEREEKMPRPVMPAR
eukprot:scaffold8179_cov126-Skeletonema_marinoi.AAC.7